ncbi:MAG: cobalt transport protein [Bryobacterales bacterium]|nr:cobalt transport protein [Bryobacterales bacterium]
MRHARLELWSRGTSFAHRRHPAAKITAALIVLVSIATLRPVHWRVALAYFVFLTAMTASARLPILRVHLAATAVLPFALVFAVLSLAAGTPERGLAIIARAWLSALTTVLLMATTTQPDLLAGLESLHAPRFLLQVMQFLYRYLLVLVEEAGAMRDAAASRAGTVGVLEFRRAAGAAGVLFGRAWTRANAIHQAMAARGFTGQIPRFRVFRFHPADLAFLVAVAGPVVALRFIAG